jgi:hypothetical protein
MTDLHSNDIKTAAVLSRDGTWHDIDPDTVPSRGELVEDAREIEREERDRPRRFRNGWEVSRNA